ncbi:MAG: hypothetical protein AAF411_22935 [Myxococcota bacterium]
MASIPLAWISSRTSDAERLAKKPPNDAVARLLRAVEAGDELRRFRAPQGRCEGYCVLRDGEVVASATTRTRSTRSDGPLEDVPESDRGTRRYGQVAPRAPDGRFDLTKVIEGDGPLEIDVGFGRGQSLFRRAAFEPKARVLGIEIKAKWAYLVEARRRREGLGQLRSWAGDVREILERADPDGSVARMYVHFPDPWWKRKHAERIVVADRFLASAARLLRDGGELFVQTDVEHRASEYAQAIAAQGAFEPPRPVDHNPFGSVSGRESQAELNGLPIHRLVARRLAR